RIESKPLQTVNYKYNIRGWLTDINDVDNLGPDLFVFKINYDESRFFLSSLTMNHNGTIAKTYWRTASDYVLRKYSYFYDEMNRLTTSIYQRPASSTASGFPLLSYDENISYDKNGNILSLQRNGDLDSATYAIETDDLEYTYDSGNRLKKVT